MVCLGKSVRPKHQTINARTKSLQYFHAFAVLDRVNLSSYSEIPLSIDSSTVDVEHLLALPSTDDFSTCVKNKLLCRVITKFLPCLQPLSDAVTWRILHIYTEEISKKSYVVSRNILMHYYVSVHSCSSCTSRCLLVSSSRMRT